MKTKHTLRLLVLAGLGPVLATTALAQDYSYFYGGLSAGMSRTKIDQDKITASLLGAGLVTNNFVRDERGQAYRIFGGYQFNRYWAVEAGYFDLGKFGFNATTVPAGSLSGQIRLNGLNLDLVATLPLSERLSLLGRVGAQSARAADRFAGEAPEPRPGLRAGHIPGSRNLPWNAVIALDGTLKQPIVLKAAFEAAGVDLSKPVITSCGSGISAAILALALERIGHRDWSLYDGSWAEWGMYDDLPVETGPAK